MNGAAGTPPPDGPALPPAPPPAQTLLDAVADLRSVPTRVPARSLLALLAGGLAVALVSLAAAGLRPDLPFLPRPWVLGMAAIWAGAAVFLFARAVLPDPIRADRAAFVTTLALLVVGLFGTQDAPGHTVMPPASASGFWGAWAHCVFFALKVTAPVLVVAALTLRRLFPLGAPRAAAAIGAGGGALAGLALLFICPYGGGLHVGLAHAGGMVFAALLAALSLGAPLRG